MSSSNRKVVDFRPIGRTAALEEAILREDYPQILRLFMEYGLPVKLAELPFVGAIVPRDNGDGPSDTFDVTTPKGRARVKITVEPLES